MSGWLAGRGGKGRTENISFCCYSLPRKLHGFKSKTKIQRAFWRRQRCSRRLCIGWPGGADGEVWPCVSASSLRVCITCFCFANTIPIKLISLHAPPFQGPPYLDQIYFVYTYNVFTNVVLFAGMKCKLHFIHNANPPNPHKSDGSILGLCSQTALENQR